MRLGRRGRAKVGGEMERVDAVVAGAGVIGLAVGRALARAGREVLVLEREPLVGSVTSARNSEVIHAGIYYPTGSLKARLCVAGRRRLYAYLAARGVGHRRCGKVIVATTAAEEARLVALREQAEANGVEDLEWLSRSQLQAMEPALNGVLALHSPVSGIVDSHGLMTALEGDLETAGGLVVLNTPVERVTRDEGGGLIVRTGGPGPMALGCAVFVNAVGLGAPALARRIDGVPAETVPQAYYAKGSYFALTGTAPFGRLVYPMPEPGGLGVHYTLDLGGQGRFGPDVEWIEGEDYDVDPDRGAAFHAAIRRYWPGLPDGALRPDYAGVRPKIAGPGEPAADFVISAPADHGVPGLINLFGIESPGLTSALALADEVLARLEGWAKAGQAPISSGTRPIGSCGGRSHCRPASASRHQT